MFKQEKRKIKKERILNTKGLESVLFALINLLELRIRMRLRVIILY
jgi:hypothetical protein